MTVLAWAYWAAGVCVFRILEDLSIVRMGRLTAPGLARELGYGFVGRPPRRPRYIVLGATSQRQKLEPQSYGAPAVAPVAGPRFSHSGSC